MSAKANVIAITRPPDPAEALRSERASIIAELAEADRRLAKLREAEREEENVIKEIASLGEREIASVRAYVAGDMTGPRPDPDAKARRALTERMARAVDATKAAGVVASEIEAQAAVARSRLGAIDSELRSLRVTTLEEQFQERVTEFAEIASKLRLTLREIRSLPLALADLGKAAVDQNDHSYARALYGAAERMRGVRLPEVEPSDAEILHTIGRLTGLIRSGSEPRRVDNEFAADIAVDPAPAPNRDALLAQAAAANQATNVVNRPDANS
jgi:hypothetical protein